MRIIDELPDQLVEVLLAEREMRFLPVPEPTREELIKANYIGVDVDTGQEVRLLREPTAEEWANCLGLSTDYEVPEPSTNELEGRHGDTAIQTLLYSYELEARLKSLMQTSESAIQEMGANILYLAFGFLEWFDSSNDTARIAPLFLVPARLRKGRLNRQTRTYQYTLSYSGEDIIPNLSLREKLRADFAMALPDLDENTKPEAYFEEVSALIQKTQPRWRLRRFISLALLNFSKLLMYLDLDPSHPNGTSIVDHPVITRFLVGYNPEQREEEHAVGDMGFGEEYRIDEIDDIHVNYPLIEDADSSQHSALIDSVDGKNLVIEGPPGTGKSQTIMNLIAAAMARGKKVLFVAEKLAALEVVRRRLDAAGLGEFCLELHSHKSQKRKILDEVRNRLNKHGRYRKPSDIEVDIARYEELKVALQGHVERINRPWKNTGRTLHEIFMAATRYREMVEINPDALHPEEYDGNNLDAATQRRTRDQVKAFRKIYEAIAGQLNDDSELQQHPWYGVRNADLQPFDLDRVKAALEGWQSALKNLSEERVKLAEGLGCKLERIPDSLHGLPLLLAELEALPVLKGDELLDQLPGLRGEELKKVQWYLEFFEDIQARYATLAEVVGPEVLQDFSIVDDLIAMSTRLRQLVAPTVTLGVLIESIERLKTMQEQLAELDEPLQRIQPAVGERAARHLSCTEAGLNEFKTLINLVAGLHPSRLWELRAELFDNEELDELLPKLREDLEQLYALRNELRGVFRLDSLPSQDELWRLKEALDAGGVLRWFKGSWRRARKQVVGCAAGNQITFSKLRALLGKAVEFVGQWDKLNENHWYKEALGDHLKGLDTDLAALESLRGWYGQVRRHYGMGFGLKVALGNAILDLPTELARDVRSLSNEGVQQLSDLLDNLMRLKEIYTPASELQSDTMPLYGKDGSIARLLALLNEALLTCEPLATDSALSVAELSNRIESLDSLKKDVIKWQTTDFDNKSFQDRLDLKPGVNTDNTASLALLHHTLSIAAWADQQLTNEDIRKRIYDQPTVSTFNALATLSGQLREVVNVQIAKHEDFAQLVGLDADDWMNQSGDKLDELTIRNSRALNSGDTLQNWLAYVRVRRQVAAMGLINLAEKVEQGYIDIQNIEDAHQAGIFDILAREILCEQPELGRFSGHSQEALQDQFREYDNQLKKLQCEQIAWQIDQTKIPQGNLGARVSEYTERFLLEHECSKKTRHLPIRQLLNRAGEALAALKPCFMMGPMSVAQYLAHGQMKFDLVVMDEASQIKPQDALGAVARGTQLVVVGDPKQLPPTSFFDRLVDDDDEDPAAIEEAESILDTTLPMFPARRLRWHYRSQHESLIAFSNHSFYESDLVLFPSPYKAADNYGVRYSKVPRGCFVNRRNMEEARSISESVREHFRHHPEESLGVVAMSAEQRLHIESTIEALAKEDSVFQDWLEKDAHREEPFFIKNLENVQGDERDVIFISMTYGPREPDGRVFQRFGPINSDVGWRRLNVLFTRSRKRMHIFSSMGSEDIIATSSAKRGVQALRDFLRFCETGVLHVTERETGRGPDSDFEIAVMARLRDEGFECVPQVGVAGFFIDVAVVDPGNRGRYLMGIECDGATYHSAKSVRDRDRLRQTILERLGWRIRRIWSTDWFRNPRAELQPIIRELHVLKTEQVEDYQLEVDPESDKTDQIIEEVKEQKAITDRFISGEIDLRERLIEFDREVIRKSLPGTPENQRLLRPAMLEAFLEQLPVSKSEFLSYMPPYLRQSTKAEEGRFLEAVLEIINASKSDSFD